MKFYITNGNGSSSWVQQQSENMKASKRQIEGYKGATVLRSRPQYNCFLTLKLQKCGGASRISTYRFEETLCVMKIRIHFIYYYYFHLLFTKETPFPKFV